MRKGIFGLAFVAVLAGCASVSTPMDDGYQFGDIGDLRAQYCANADPRQRAIVLALMYQAGVPIPPRGACTEILDMIDPADLPPIDVDAARKDQERFSE